MALDSHGNVGGDRTCVRLLHGQITPLPMERVCKELHRIAGIGKFSWAGDRVDLNALWWRQGYSAATDCHRLLQYTANSCSDGAASLGAALRVNQPAPRLQLPWWWMGSCTSSSILGHFSQFIVATRLLQTLHTPLRTARCMWDERYDVRLREPMRFSLAWMATALLICHRAESVGVRHRFPFSNHPSMPRRWRSASGRSATMARPDRRKRTRVVVDKPRAM